jgi:hypothetical protein
MNDRMRAFQLAGGSITDETIVQSALFLASFVEWVALRDERADAETSLKRSCGNWGV